MLPEDPVRIPHSAGSQSHGAAGALGPVHKRNELFCNTHYSTHVPAK